MLPLSPLVSEHSRFALLANKLHDFDFILHCLQIATKKKDLKKKLRVSFTGEPGLDLGGLTKEWFLLLIRRIFREEYGK